MMVARLVASRVEPTAEQKVVGKAAQTVDHWACYLAALTVEHSAVCLAEPLDDSMVETRAFG